MSTLQEKSLLDSDEYPGRWTDYIGQEDAKRMLRIAAKSARIRKQPLDHVLISHPSPGVGKTALAVLIATEMRSRCVVVSGQISKDRARTILSTMEDGDVLLYDEIHQVLDAGRRGAEWLLHFLQDGQIAGPVAMETQPRVTLVGATTEAHRFPSTIVSRFPLVPPMADYTTEEAAKVAQVISRRVLADLPTLGRPDALMLAEASHNNPRAIRQMLTVLRDMTITDELPLLAKGRYDIVTLLEFQGVTLDGLDRVAQRYLRVLSEFGTVGGARAIEDRMQQPGGLAMTERVLMDKGLIAKTRSGRALTQAGIRRVNQMESA